MIKAFFFGEGRPKWFNFCLQLCQVPNLHFCRQVVLGSRYKFSVQVRRFGLSVPPVYVVFLQKLLGMGWNTLWSIVLHESMLSTVEVSLDEWNKAVIKYGHVEVRIHKSSENGNSYPVAPCLVIPALTCTLAGCLGRGFHFDCSPFLQKHRSFQFGSILNITFSKLSFWCCSAHSSVFCVLTSCMSWR